MLTQQGSQPSPDPEQLGIEQRAFAALFAELEAILRKKASILLRYEQSPSIRTGDLLNDLYLRLQKNPAYSLAIAAQGQSNFLAMAAEAMRHILTDAARKRRSRNSFTFITLSHIDEGKPAPYSPEDVICLDEALRVLEHSHPRRAAIIKLRFYAGLSVGQLQQHFALCDATIENDIRSALKTLHGILEPKK